MLRYLTIFMLITCTLLPAASPKPFAKIGDPVYRNVTPVTKLLKSKSFEKQRHFFSTFAKEAKAAKTEGFALEKLTDPAQRKKRSKAYISKLRQLGLENKEIGKTVKRTMFEAIKKKRNKAFKRILDSNHSVLTEDKNLAREITRYKSTLVKKKKAVKKEKKRLLRSSENLNGLWQNHSSALNKWRFKGKALSVSSETKQKRLWFEGTWKINAKQLSHTIHTITNQRKNQKAHTRKTKVTRHYTLLSISQSTLKFKDMYGDIFELKKQ